MTTHFSRAAFSSLILAIITEAKLLFSFSWALLSFLSVVASPLADSFTILSKRPPPAHGLLLAAFHDADHWICLSAEYRLINAFTATINKTAERLLKLRSTAQAALNQMRTCRGGKCGIICVCLEFEKWSLSPSVDNQWCSLLQCKMQTVLSVIYVRGGDWCAATIIQIIFNALTWLVWQLLFLCFDLDFLHSNRIIVVWW